MTTIFRHLSFRRPRADSADGSSKELRKNRRQFCLAPMAGKHFGALPVRLPNIKWGLLYGVLLCNARAMGASSAQFRSFPDISAGKTNTIPLHVEILYNEYNFAAAFAVASILTILALVTLLIKTFIELKFSRKIKHGH